MPTYRTSASSLARGAGAGLLVAIAVAVLWRFFPAWEFYLCLLLGFGTVEAIARFSGNKRGADLQLLAMGIVTVGLVLSRVLLAQRFGVSLGDVNALEAQLVTPEIIEEFGFRGASVSDVLQLRLVPDLVYTILVYLIAWVRFR